MIDWQRHERELTSSRIADDVVRSGRRTRRRRLALVLATVVGVCGLVVVVLPAVASVLPSRPSTAVSGAGSPAVRPVDGSLPPARAVDDSDRTQLYLLVLAAPRLGAARTLVANRLCVGASQRPVLPCRGAVIPQRVRAAVERAAPSVRFVADPTWPQRLDQPAVVGFGRLVVRGDRASLETESLCGSLCGTGERRTFVRHDGRWVATADVRGGWIS